MKMKKIRENIWIEAAIENLENREELVVPNWWVCAMGINCWIFPGDPCYIWGCISNFICSAPYS